MGTINEEKIKNVITFSEKVNAEICSNNRNLLEFLQKFSVLYKNELKQLPYHINLIDELHANENAHSRILEKLLKQQDAITGRFEILESFVLFIIEKYSRQEDFQKIKIDSPIITQETKRIDLWIRDTNYAIVIENKVYNAIDQQNQLERYIDQTIEEKYKENNIYVLYLPPTYEKEPTKESWGRFYDSEIHKKRYLCLSFKNDILPWLNNYVLPNINSKDKYLSSAIEQYIDHLEGKFNIRKRNNKMNMNLQEFLKNELGINGVTPEKALKIVQDKKEEIQNTLSHIDELEKGIMTEYFQEWNKLLKNEFPSFKIIGNVDNPDKCINVGIQLVKDGYSFSVLIEYNFQSIYYGIGRHYSTDTIIDSLKFEKIITHFDFEPSDKWWYAWGYTSFPDAYNDFRSLLEFIQKNK